MKIHCSAYTLQIWQTATGLNHSMAGLFKHEKTPQK